MLSWLVCGGAGGPAGVAEHSGGEFRLRCWIQALLAVVGQVRHGGEQVRVDLHIHLGIDGIETLRLVRGELALAGPGQLFLDPRGILGFHADGLERAGGRGELRAGGLLDEDLGDVSCVGVELEILFGDLGVVAVAHRLRGRRGRSLERFGAGGGVASDAVAGPRASAEVRVRRRLRLN